MVIGEEHLLTTKDLDCR